MVFTTKFQGGNMSNDVEKRDDGKEAGAVVVGTTATGAAVGAMIGGPIGAAVGGLIGAAVGATAVIVREGNM